MQIRTIKDEYYLTRAQYEARKLNNQLVTGASYFITDENYILENQLSPWAKQSTKPTYSPQEVGAIDEDNEITGLEVLQLWNGGNS